MFYVCIFLSLLVVIYEKIGLIEPCPGHSVLHNTDPTVSGETFFSESFFILLFCCIVMYEVGCREKGR